MTRPRQRGPGRPRTRGSRYAPLQSRTLDPAPDRPAVVLGASQIRLHHRPEPGVVVAEFAHDRQRRIGGRVVFGVTVTTPRAASAAAQIVRALSVAILRRRRRAPARAPTVSSTPRGGEHADVPSAASRCAPRSATQPQIFVDRRLGSRRVTRVLTEEVDRHRPARIEDLSRRRDAPAPGSPRRRSVDDPSGDGGAGDRPF